MSKTKLRQPEDVHQPCLTCNRKFFKSDAHWCCDKCRQFDERAACPENCDACIAMVEEEWRRKALEMNLYKKKMYVKSKGKYGVQSRKTPYKKKPIKRKSEKDETPSKSAKVIRSEKKDKSVIEEIDPAYSRRLLDFEALFYGGLNPSIPSSLTEKGFKLPEIPKRLKSMYDITKWELVRLLATSSICYHLSKNRMQFSDENNQIFNANSDGIVSLFAALIKFKANSFGKVIFDIREALLSNVTCIDRDIIPQMIKGPINPKESFFGNIDALKEAVKRDNRNVLKIKGKSSSIDLSSSDELNEEQINSDDSQF